MAITKSPSFKYAKNFIIGVGAAIVMLGALYKIQSWEMPTIGGVKFDLLTIGLGVEAFLFLLIGVLGPEPDYYWDKLYPGLSNYDANVMPLSSGGVVGAPVAALNGEVVEQQLGGMLTELQNMSKSMSSLKALQDADFSGTGEQIRQMGNFYAKLNEAMADLAATSDQTKAYKENMIALNGNLSTLNTVYGNMISAMRVSA
ncbi:gliding motility protein GldL [Neolewinella lacunae]|uniref:Gliding motility protein GldL n=1 Tax=Neolewinella lacunae TaxID=1517758 RepID=A0A923PQA9_9BACT|nr:gliding motility protein GldL [Neolewinella lacunae]MBC6995509.1 gliding motility protein GldL [Neolewinella lacunae]MDN3635097.1 gliding motility protein GldL [Neolewinella lacunae]